MKIVRDILWFVTALALFGMVSQLMIERYELRKKGQALVRTVYAADSLVTYWKTLKCVPRGR